VPRNRKAAARNQRWTAWIDQGLKPERWSATRLARLGLLLGIVLAVAGLYLLQSSEIVTASRRVQALSDQLTQLQQDNAELVAEIGELGSIEQLRRRAEALGFQAAQTMVYLPVRYLPLEDQPSLQDIYLPPLAAGH
jgi:Tfp pilus assembly protein PilN